MSDNQNATTGASIENRLEGGAYEIIRSRLVARAEELRGRQEQLNAARKQVFGAIDTRVLATQLVTTSNSCIPRDIAAVGDKLLFGYNVHLGLRSETEIADVFAVYTYANREFKEAGHGLLGDERFREDFRNLYRYYKKTRFAQFHQQGERLFMIFCVGDDANAIKTFKWVIRDGGALEYADNRSDHELGNLPQHELEWKRTTRDQHRKGEHPHISIEDKVFVETVGGDLTIKIEDNTEIGAGIYAEPVENKDQTLDDAEIYYAVLGNLVLLKIRPYQEKDFRHLVFASKTLQACRLDALAEACVLLPEDHGFIFPSGYFLQTGEYKEFEDGLGRMRFLRRVSSPNGEDTLFVFFEPESGTYVLLSYNMIEQRVDTPLICNGFSLFENGELVCFRAEKEPTKHHAIQIWQTPFVGPNFVITSAVDSFLYKIGNRDLVRAMAGCRHVLGLVAKNEAYADVYVDLAREASALLDTYFWLDNAEAFDVKAPLVALRDAAASAIDEFDKVVRVRKETAQRVAAAENKTTALLRTIRARRYESIEDFVGDLSGIRVARGEVISLKDLRYVDLPKVARLDNELVEASGSLAGRSVAYLLTDGALDPYWKKVAEIEVAVPVVTKAADAKQVEDRAIACGKELELLIETVSNLKIDDATQRTAIIERISEIFAKLNQVRSSLRNRISDLASTEGQAEFASQMRLLDQAVVGYLDVCDTPDRCEEYLQKISVQLTELEGKFSAFEGFVVELAGKRADLMNAFETRKLAIVEARNKRADTLLRSAERILEGVRTRADKLNSQEEINGYFASDLLVSKVRDVIADLGVLGDSVKADDLQARLRTLLQESLRQLKDRKELFVAGQNVVKLGEHHFSVSTEEIALSVLPRDGRLYLHLAGTKLFEEIPDEQIANTRPVWDQVLVSENAEVYRAEYLAHALFTSDDAAQNARLSEAHKAGPEALTALVRELMGPRYAEGYAKGVHDVDAAKLLLALLELRGSIGLLRYPATARALALLAWTLLPDEAQKHSVELRFSGLSALRRMSGTVPHRDEHVAELARFIGPFAQRHQLFVEQVDNAAEYLLEVLLDERRWAVSKRAQELYEGLMGYVERRGASEDLSGPIAAIKGDPASAQRLALSWALGYAQTVKLETTAAVRAEVAALLVTGVYDRRFVVLADPDRFIEGMVGSHGRLDQGRCHLNFEELMQRLARYKRETVVLFEQHAKTKQRLLAEASVRLKLSEMKPKVMSAFVRNKLIDTIYLPLVGTNLAKQIGVVGDKTRTDRMGLLLLVSPPGYGKTTLMEYVASRLGLAFMKVNGPAIGSKVTSLDPAEAPNAAAREEIARLNLAFEMGDNTMIYLDDIQHLSPELLQKFISLCDAQRKIEGVYQGRTRTYDLRGRKVCVVMAGNPYSESGELFKIPDMLANRADTYNLGEIIGGSLEAFKLSYLENAATSNQWLARLATKSFKDFYAVVAAVETGTKEALELEASHSAEELAEAFKVIEKLLRVQHVILTVNKEYIRSAAQADEFRTEPPFKLQGSYRNMNRIAEKVLPIMNDAELEQLIMDHYQSEAQTLTTGAEANLLRFKELLGKQDAVEATRWDEIRRTFNRNQLMRSAGGDDRMGQILAQLSTFSDGLNAIQRTLADGIKQIAIPFPLVTAQGEHPNMMTTADDHPPMAKPVMPGGPKKP